jgi:hypothetical protein
MIDGLNVLSIHMIYNNCVTLIQETVYVLWTKCAIHSYPQQR